MNYIVIELQTTGGTTAHIITAHATRAEAELERCAGKRGEYGLFSNNCHAFTRYCITGERSTEGAFGEAEIEAALESVFKTQVVWIPMGRV